MQKTLAGWCRADLIKVYDGFGFQKREGGSHTIFIHPQHRHLRATIPKSRKLGKAYISDAIFIIGQLKKLEAESNEG